jgi:hypothetical protein
MDADVMRGPPFQCGDQRSGRIGISVSRMPVALRMALAIAGEVGTVATSPMPTLPPEHMVETAFVEMHVDHGVSAMPGMR